MLLLKHTGNIRRWTALGTNGRRQRSTVASNVRCLVLPASASTTITMQFDLGRGYDIYFEDGTDIRIGDQITSGGQTYEVKFVQPFSGVGSVSHIHVVAQQEVT